jgi:hypothetical protein
MRRALAIALGLVSAFWMFYTARLLVVTGFLTRTRTDGAGAFVGAAVFPLLALLFGWGARAVWRGARAR